MSTENPWKKLDQSEVFRNDFLSLRVDRVIRPDGAEGTYSVIDTRIATGAAALTPDNEVYLVGQYRYPTDYYSWEIPEGGSDPGEGALETIQRELREEAGLIAKRWTPLGRELHVSNCISSEVGYLYLAEDLTEIESEPDPTEILQIKKVISHVFI